MNNLLVEQVDKKINLRVYIEIKKKLEKKTALPSLVTVTVTW